MRRLRVLLWLPTPTYFGSLLRIAVVLKEAGIEPVIYAPVYFRGTPDFEARSQAAGVAYLRFMKSDLSGYMDKEEQTRSVGLWANDRPRAKATKDVVDERLANLTSWVGELQQADPQAWAANHEQNYDMWKRLNRSLLDEADFLIDHMNIDLVITPDETIDYSSQYFIASMKAVGRTSMLFPFAVPSADEVDDVLVHNKSYIVADACQQLFAQRFPRWIRTVDGVDLTRVPMARAAAVEEDGLAPRYPWLSFTSDSDVVGLNSAYLQDRYVDLGAEYRRQSMFVIGSPEDDDIERTRAQRQSVRKELANMFSWSQERPIALVNPVGDLRGQYALPEFTSYEELLRFWLRSLAKLTNFNVVITPHPGFRFHQAERDVLEAEAKNIAWRGASELLPACDLYISYGGSSTLRLAAATGVPVLNYLCYALRLAPEDEKSYFVGFDSIAVARSSREFTEALERINASQEYASMRGRANRAAPYFGMQTGDFAQRLTKLIQGVTQAAGTPGEQDLIELRRRLDG